MKKKIVKTELDQIDIQPPKEDKLAKIEGDIFKPTKLQRKAKALLMSQIKAIPGSLELITCEQAIQMTGVKEIKRYWNNPEFYNWFLDTQSHLTRVNYLLHRQIDNLEEVIEDDAEIYTAKDKMTAGRHLLDIKKSFEKDDEDKAGMEDKLLKIVETVLLKQEEEEKIEPIVRTKQLGSGSVSFGGLEDEEDLDDEEA